MRNLAMKDQMNESAKVLYKMILQSFEEFSKIVTEKFFV